MWNPTYTQKTHNLCHDDLIWKKIGFSLPPSLHYQWWVIHFPALYLSLRMAVWHPHVQKDASAHIEWGIQQSPKLLTKPLLRGKGATGNAARGPATGRRKLLKTHAMHGEDFGMPPEMSEATYLDIPMSNLFPKKIIYYSIYYKFIFQMHLIQKIEHLSSLQ